MQYVFDMVWYTFARLFSDVISPIDKDINYFESQGSILTCMGCGKYFVRHPGRQLYCQNQKCQVWRKNRKAGAYYEQRNNNKNSLVVIPKIGTAARLSS